MDQGKGKISSLEDKLDQQFSTLLWVADQTSYISDIYIPIHIYRYEVTRKQFYGKGSQHQELY